MNRNQTPIKVENLNKIDEKLIYVDHYFDGPLEGITIIDGRKYYFITPFSEELDDYESVASLFLIDELLTYKHLADIDEADSPIERVDLGQIKSLLAMILEKSITPTKARPHFKRTSPGIVAKCFDVSWELLDS